MFWYNKTTMMQYKWARQHKHRISNTYSASNLVVSKPIQLPSAWYRRKMCDGMLKVFILWHNYIWNTVCISAWSSYSKLEYSTSFNPQISNLAKLKLKIPEKLVLLEPKLEILEQKLSLICVQTRQFETR